MRERWQGRATTSDELIHRVTVCLPSPALSQSLQRWGEEEEEEALC